jgi:hypothetical protein
MYGEYEWSLNGYGSTTTQSYVYNCTKCSNDEYDEAVVFHVGHGFNYGTYMEHYYYYSNDGNSSSIGIKDQDIYDRTDNGNHGFVFIWACNQGDEIRNSSATGAAGMPYAWCHTDYLSSNGYTNPYGNNCFIGWMNASKPVSETLDSYNYGDFIQIFYYYALNGESIIDALDDASAYCWNYDPRYWDSFNDVTPLYSGYNYENPNYDPNNPSMGPQYYWSNMVVYGNGNYVLP